MNNTKTVYGAKRRYAEVAACLGVALLVSGIAYI